MKNFIQRGDVLEITAGADIAAGAGVKVGVLFGVATGAIANGAKGTINLTGVYSLPKVGSQAWSVGAAIYWNGTACTTATTAGNLLIGTAWEDVGGAAGATTGVVRLNGAAPAAVTS